MEQEKVLKMTSGSLGAKASKEKKPIIKKGLHIL
jgi:hypothetical protein